MILLLYLILFTYNIIYNIYQLLSLSFINSPSNNVRQINHRKSKADIIITSFFLYINTQYLLFDILLKIANILSKTV